MQPEVPGSLPAWLPLPEQAVEYRLLPVFFQARPWRGSSLLALVLPFAAYHREGTCIWASNHRGASCHFTAMESLAGAGLGSQRAMQRPRKYMAVQGRPHSAQEVEALWTGQSKARGQGISKNI